MIEGVPQEERPWPLAKVDILRSLSLEEIERLALVSAPIRLGEGEAFALDEERRIILMLTSGRVRVHEPSAAGPGLTISIIEEPTVVMRTGFAARPPRVVVVEALEPCVVQVLSEEEFDDLVRRNPEVGVKTIRLLGERLSACEGRLLDLARKEVPARLASLILNLSKQQGITTAEGGRMIPARYTHNLLASMVGSNREAVTRALGRLRKAGAVKSKGRHIYVTDVDALNRVAEIGR